MTTGLFGRRVSSSNEILPRLYLGDINTALNREELIRLGITDMITVEVKPIAPELLPSTIQRYLYINVMDHSKQDLLSHFATSNEFIETALKNSTNKVYVHCVAGVSRSATLVISFVMKTRCMSFQEARDLVVQKRRVVDPNEGFVCQLVLFHQMGYKIDVNNLQYRRMVFEALVFEFRLFATAFYQQAQKSQQYRGKRMNPNHPSTSSHLNAILSNKVILNILPSTFGFKSSTSLPNSDLPMKSNVTFLFEQYFNKLHLQEVRHFPDTYDTKTAYKCNKCRSIIFFPISLIENHISSDQQEIYRWPRSSKEFPQANKLLQQPKAHTQPESQSQTANAISETISAMERFNLAKDVDSKNNTKLNPKCPFYFIEPQPWMIRSIGECEGNLECYKCKKKLGKFDWDSRESCSCELHNSHLNINLFKIMKKNVDASLIMSVAE